MRRFFCFYWECTKTAARGNAAPANDWQWVFANPLWQSIGAAIGAALGAYLAQYWRGAPMMSPDTPIGIFLGGLFGFAATWLAFFAVRFVKAPVMLFHQEQDRANLERARADNLAERLMPKISVFLDQICRGVRVVETSKHDDPLARGPDSKWIQFSVKSATDAPLIDCTARLLIVERLKVDGSTESILDEPMFFQWSNADGGQNTRMSIPSGVSQPSNMFSISEGQTLLKPETAPYMKPRMLREIQKPGKYRLDVAVSATDVPVEQVSLLLEWGGSYEQIGLTME